MKVPLSLDFVTLAQRGMKDLCIPRQMEAHLYLPWCFCLIAFLNKNINRFTCTGHLLFLEKNWGKIPG